MRARWLVVVGLFAGALVWLWQSTQRAPITEPPAAPPTTRAAPQRRITAPTRPAARLTLPPRTSTFDATSHHTADPCTAVAEPIIPSTFEQITAANITVAWEPSETTEPYDAPLRPIALAFTVAGLLEEAAQLTGTDRRQSLTVIVDASAEEFQGRTKTPAWVAGLYDGAAVRLPGRPSADIGVDISTLRHEVMHAQMHAAIGCTPFWFNEGLANYFGGPAPVREWIHMLRTGEPFDLTTLRDPAILDVKAENAKRMYAVSLAMVLYLVDRAGETAIREAVRVAQTAATIPDALELWQRVAPNVEHRLVVEALAQRVFGMVPSPELDTLVQGKLCCQSLPAPAELKCRAPTEGRREVCRRY